MKYFPYCVRALALSVLATAAVVAGCSSSSASPPPPHSPDASPALDGGEAGEADADLPLSPGEGTVHVTTGGVITDYAWSDGTGGLVACTRSASDPMMLVRLARGAEHGGSGDPHLDIDVCKPWGDGEYAAFAPLDGPCQPRTFDVFWHATEGTFVNKAFSTNCTLTLNTKATVLRGTLRCDDLEIFQGSTTRASVRASFACALP